METHSTHELRRISLTIHLARHVWVAFLITFIVARTFVILMALDWLPNFHVQLGATHVHHLNFGILILALVGAFLLFLRPSGRTLRAAATIYGVGLALTFDEFGMWLRLEDVYWQRASFDAMAVIGGLLGLLAVSPTLKRLRPRHWIVALGLAAAIVLFGLLVLLPLWSAGRNLDLRLQ
jgi:hypothetical protein